MSKKNKKYNVVVRGQREEKVLSQIEPVEYIVPAEDKDKAIIIAKKEYGKDNPNLVDVKAVVNKKMNILSIIFLSIACFLSFIPWHLPDGSVIFLKPSLISMLFSVAIYSSVILRIKGLKNSFNSATETICTCLNFIFIASFISLFTGDAEIKLFNFTIPISGKLLLIFAALLSWVGMEKVAKFVWIALFVFAAFRLLAVDAAMGIWGVVYVLFGFLGIVFQLKQESDVFLQKVNNEFISAAAKARSIVKIGN